MRRTILLIALCWLSASVATAQHSVGVLGAYQDAKDGDAGYGGTVRYQWDRAPGAGSVRCIAQTGYLTGFGEEESMAEDDVSAMLDLEFDVVPVELAVLYDVALYERGGAYFGVGGGYYVTDSDFVGRVDHGPLPESVTVDYDFDVESDDEFGAFALVGWEQGLSDSLGLFVEARYTYLEVDAEWRGTGTVSMDGAPVYSESDAGSGQYDLSGFGVSLGLRWAW